MQNKLKILVTGSEGFLGRHTVRYMTEQGHTVTGIDMDKDIFKYGYIPAVVPRTRKHYRHNRAHPCTRA